MKKRLLSGLLAAALALSLLPAALAVPPEPEMAQVLSALDIMSGYPDGDLRLGQNVSRAEFTKMAVAASPMGKNVGSATTVSPYPDVPCTHWAAPYVEAAVSYGLVNGFLDGTFRPNQTITLAEGVTIAVRLLGYQDRDFSATWPSGQMTLYRNQDLDDGITGTENLPMTRRDSMCLFYNLLTAKTKEGRPYLTMLGQPLTPSGEIDRVAIVNAAMDGPVVMAPGWAEQVGFSTAGATVYRGGKLSSLAALQPNDLLYYSKSMRTVWAYTGKVSGQIQALSPSAANPSAVTIAGRTYPIETADAAYALSNLGSHQTGDSVTLLLGRGGGIAAVVDPGQGSGTVYGVVTAETTAQMNDANGNPYTTKAVAVTATDGSPYVYPIGDRDSFDPGDLIQVVLSGGQAKVSRLGQTSVTGKVSSDAARLGSTPLAADVEILDVDDDGAAVRLYADRLAGMTLNSGDVKFVHRDTSGAIDVLILNNVTGDLYTYGVLTKVEEMDATPAPGVFVTNGQYFYDVGGRPCFYVLQNGKFNAKKGPVRIKGNVNAPTAMTSLERVELRSLDAFSAADTRGETYPVWHNVSVYELRDGDYHYSSLERVRSGFSLAGYYDGTVRDGRTLRVIVATPKN